MISIIHTTSLQLFEHPETVLVTIVSNSIPDLDTNTGTYMDTYG
jgi:hypothetical protein